MFSCTLLHGTNPVMAPRINMRTALSKSHCSVLHLFQCWSSLRCQRNPVLASARNLLCISLLSRWQGRYGSCQFIPLSPSPCLLLGESWRHFQRCGRPVAFWEMQSFVNDRRMAKWSEQHWNHVTECHLGTTSCNNNAVLCIFVSLCQSSHSLFLSTSFLAHSSFTNQGFEKGWSDYRGTAEEDCEQPQSTRISHQEWPSTCLKEKKKNLNPTNKNTGDLSAVGNSNLI